MSGTVASRRPRPAILAGPRAALVAGLCAVAALLSPLGGRLATAQEADGESSPVEADEAIGAEQVVVADGHVDVGPRFVDGDFTLLVRDDTVKPSVWRHLGDVVLQATDAAVVGVPDDPTFAFLGAPGDPVWLLPQVQQPGILWPGWNTQDPEVATTVERQVSWTLTGVDGPGAFVLFVNQDFGQPATIFDSRSPYPQQTGIDLNTHAHGNWAFTEPGIYRLDLEMSGTTIEGDDVTASGTLQLAVGDATNPQDAFAANPVEDGAGSRDDAASTTDGEPPEAPGRDPADQDRATGPTGDDEGASARWLGLGAVALALVAAGAVLVGRTRSRPPGEGS